MRFMANDDWSGMTPQDFRIAIEWLIPEIIYPTATAQQLAEVMPMYKNRIDYAMYSMCCAQFPFEDKSDWSLEQSLAHFSNMSLDANAKKNFFVGYMNNYFYRYIHDVELRNLYALIEANSDLSIDLIVDYFLTFIVCEETIDEDPDAVFEYHQLKDISPSRIKALESVRDEIVTALSEDDEVSLFKSIYYLMTYFAGSSYRGVHRAVMPLLGFEDFAAARELFYANVASLIEHKGGVRLRVSE